MSKMIKAIKQVSAVAASTLLLSSSAFANLGNYGSNFVKDGKFSGQVVVGTMTGADDVSAANVVIADLKSKYANSEDTYTLTYSKSSEGGASATLNFDDELTLGSKFNEGIDGALDKDDFSFLGEDKITTDVSGKEYEYS
jgi:hypothetical protein